MHAENEMSQSDLERSSRRRAREMQDSKPQLTSLLLLIGGQNGALFLGQ